MVVAMTTRPNANRRAAAARLEDVFRLFVFSRMFLIFCLRVITGQLDGNHFNKRESSWATKLGRPHRRFIYCEACGRFGGPICSTPRTLPP